MSKVFEIKVFDRKNVLIYKRLLNAECQETAEWELSQVLDEIEGASTYEVAYKCTVELGDYCGH